MIPTSAGRAEATSGDCEASPSTERSVLVAASDRIVVLDHQLDVVDSFLNPYLKHCHEIYRAGDTLWLLSTDLGKLVLGFP